MKRYRIYSDDLGTGDSVEMFADTPEEADLIGESLYKKGWVCINIDEICSSCGHSKLVKAN